MAQVTAYFDRVDATGRRFNVGHDAVELNRDGDPPQLTLFDGQPFRFESRDASGAHYLPDSH